MTSTLPTSSVSALKATPEFISGAATVGGDDGGGRGLPTGALALAVTEATAQTIIAAINILIHRS
jgi:hypothetical protein